jgi:hypothetical protein
MLNRDNAVGFILLGICAVIALVMIGSIVSGERIRLSINPVLGTILGVGFIGLILFGMFSGRRGGGGPMGQRQWPDPQTGRRSWWDRLRGR